MLKQCIIIGGGPAGTAAALAAVESGLKEVLIVERDAFGGTCTNRGCIPTKFLLTRSETIAVAGHAADGSGGWRRALQHKKALVQGLARSVEESLRTRGIGIARGSARFIAGNAIEVLDGGEGGRTARFEAERFVVAAGSRPAELLGSASNRRSILTSDDALDLETPPASLAIIGSGAVGAEFAFIFTRLGTKVTLIEAADRIFPAEDRDVDPVFRKVYDRLGVTVHTADAVRAIEPSPDHSSVRVTLASGSVVDAEKALVAIGRGLESRGLGCEAAGIAVGAAGAISVDDQLRTSQPHILAAGDVTGRMLLAHAATYMGEFAGRFAAGVAFAPVPFASIPWVTFTSPEVAGVGLTVEAARGLGLDAVSGSAPFVDNVKARIDRASEGFVKLVAERGTGRLLGGTIVGKGAAELIHVIALAVHQRMSADSLRGFVFAHPSIAETIADAVRAVNAQGAQ